MSMEAAILFVTSSLLGPSGSFPASNSPALLTASEGDMALRESSSSIRCRTVPVMTQSLPWFFLMLFVSSVTFIHVAPGA